MPLKRRFKRWLTLLVLAAIAFAQASFAFSDCQVGRGRLAQAIGITEKPPCSDSVMAVEAWTKYTNRCLAHCTADLQATGTAVALVRAPAGDPVLLLVRVDRLQVAGAGLEAPPLGAPPLRVLLHSFLV